MRSIVVDSLVDGDIVAPFPLNNELAAVGADFHSLDRWNFDANSLAATKASAGAWGRKETWGTETAETFTVTDGTSANDILAVPGPGVGLDAWVQVVETVDCALMVSFGCAAFFDSGVVEAPMWIGVRVDGELIAQTGPSRYLCFTGWADIFGIKLVGAGTHIIEPVFGVHPPSSTSGVTAAAFNVEFRDRVLTLREVAR